MRFALLIAALFVPIGVLSVPTVRTYEYAALSARQNRPVKPKPCVSVAGTTEDQTHERFNQFADAFIYKKNITAAFELIRQDYIVRSPPSILYLMPSTLCLFTFIVADWLSDLFGIRTITPQPKMDLIVHGTF
jgi:hypothetical protein